jgi:molybdenum transport protein
MYIADETIDKFIKEDVPYFDLTTTLLSIGQEEGVISFTTREDAVLCGTEEVCRIFVKLGIEPTESKPSGTWICKGETFLSAKGLAESLHTAWRLSMNIIEYSSGIATRTKKLLDAIKSVNPAVELLSTRKLFPGTKELSVKAVLAAGVMPHRLGLSETILVFKQHLNFVGGLEPFLRNYQEIKQRACDKSIIVEVDTLQDAKLLSKAGVDGIQLDKLPPEALKNIVEEIRTINPNVKIIATGGITEDNVKEYAATGVDALSTSSVYFGKPIDISVKIDKAH